VTVEDWLYRRLYELEDGHWWFRGRRAIIWALLQRAGLPNRVRLLDAGCGTGRNLVELGFLGPAAGVDGSPEAVAFCHARGLGDVREAQLDALPFPDGAYDLLIATDVIEHVDDDEGVLRELRRVAAPGARLLITTPAYRWLWSAHDEEHQHKRRYTRRVLLRRVRGAGWEPEIATYFNSLLLGPIALARALPRGREANDYDRTPRLLNGALSLPMRLEAALVRRGVRFPAGVSIGVVCRAA
jgi:SAM-dependent methyltransferase